MSEVWSSGVKGLGRKHGSTHHVHLAGVRLELGAIRLHLLAELLIQEHVPDAMLCRDVVVELTVKQP